MKPKCLSVDLDLKTSHTRKILSRIENQTSLQAAIC